jgi:hypothetical protein
VKVSVEFFLTNHLGTRCRWEDNIKMGFKEIRFEYVDLIHLAQNRVQLQALVNMVMNLQIP